MLAGGGPPQGVDFLTAPTTSSPGSCSLVLVLTYLLLMRAFRSLVLPLKAVLLNLLSVAAAYGVLVVIFRWGAGSDVLGLYQFPQIEGWIPIFLFAMLFGLSMDYEVFLVSRMRESWDDTHGQRPRRRATGSSGPGGSSPPPRSSWSPPSRASWPGASSGCRSSGSGSRLRSSSTRRSSGWSSSRP